MQRQPGVGLHGRQGLDPGGHKAFRVLLLE